MRNWGALITLVGAMLIYGAFNPAMRPLVLTIAGLSKLIFIGLVLAYGRQYLGGQAGTLHRDRSRDGRAVHRLSDPHACGVMRGP